MRKDFWKSTLGFAGRQVVDKVRQKINGKVAKNNNNNKYKNAV
jgi:hypothetical protein